jgi:hypothetical protein
MKLSKSMPLVLALLLAALVASACSPAPTPTPTPDAEATGTSIAANIFATQTASVPTATGTPTATNTPTLTATPTITNTPLPTNTPPPTDTPTITPNLVATQAALNRQATAAVADCIHTTTLAPPSWRVILCDTFDANVNGWPTGNVSSQYGTGNRQITGGKYRWDDTAHQGEVLYAFPKISSVGDFYLTVLGRRISGPQGAAYGVMLRNDGINYYFLEIRDDQVFRFSRWYQHEWMTLINWTRAAAIQPSQANRLTVKAEGSHFTFFINDQQVGESDDNQLSGGRVGLETELFNGGDSAVFEFDNFELRAP